MPTNTKPNPTYKKYRDAALLYDMDLFSRRLIRIRLTLNQDGNTLPTPVTPLYEERFTGDNPLTIPARDFEPRNLDCCFNSNDKEVHRTVYVPYRSNLQNHNNHIKEVLNYGNNLITANYTGEIHNKNLESYIPSNPI